MPDKVEFVVQNKLVKEKRALNVYHHATKSAYMISHNNNVMIPIEPVEKDDYLHISMVSGPGDLTKECLIDIPSRCFVTFSGLSNGHFEYKGEIVRMRIPPGPAVWQVRVSTSEKTGLDKKTADILIYNEE